MSGKSALTDLQEPNEHFIRGEVIGSQGMRLIKFTVDFEVNHQSLKILKALGEGISYCVGVYGNVDDEHVYYLHFASNPDRNQMIRLALEHRNRVNAHYGYKSVTPTPPVIQRETSTTPKHTRQTPPAVFSDPQSSRK